MTRQATATREEEFLRRLRPRELRDLPNEFYEVVLRQARRIVLAEWQIARVRRSIARARTGIAEGTWPAVMQREWDSEAHDWHPEPRPHLHEEDPVFVCWLIDGAAGPEGLVHLHALHALVQGYRAETPWGRECRWGHISRASFNGGLRSLAHLGLVAHVAPLTWTLTEDGRDLLDLVFGREDD